MRAKKLGIAILILVGVITASFVIAEMKDGLNIKQADASPLGGNTLYVGGSGPNNYTKIQDAIDNASDGDTVFVYNGTYNENVVVNKRINLIGEDRNKTIIDGGGSGDVIHFYADDVVLNGFTIRNGDNGIHLSSSSDCTINDNVISNNENGVYLWYSNRCTITSNTISSDNKYGIGLEHSNDSAIMGNIIGNDGLIGIILWDSVNCTITSNAMVNDDILIHGYLLEHWGTHTINTSNTVNGKPVYYLKNTVGGTVPAGAGEVILANCTSVVVEYQDLYNRILGIELGFSSNCDITNNNISGIRIESSSNCAIAGNTISNSVEDSIYVDSSNNCSIISNYISNNQYGVWLYSSNNCSIIGNTIINNTWNGIQLLFVRGCAIDYNIVSNNKGNAIEIISLDKCSITGNTIRKNWNGINLSSSSNVIIKNCNIYNNNIGIHMRESLNIGIHLCNIYRNRDYGIYNQNSEERYQTNARWCWWGYTTGPSHPSNPYGEGNKVSDNVLFKPWLPIPSLPAIISMMIRYLWILP